jgi:hypothetical protein
MQAPTLTHTMTCLLCAVHVRRAPQAVGGTDNVVAVVPKTVKLDTAGTENTDSVVLRCPNPATALELRKRLTASASQMAAVAGLLDVSLSCCAWRCGLMHARQPGAAAATALMLGDLTQPACGACCCRRCLPTLCCTAG